jgi:hypothetical protein
MRFPSSLFGAIFIDFGAHFHDFSRSEAHANARGTLSENQRKPSQGPIRIEVRRSPRSSEFRLFLINFDICVRTSFFIDFGPVLAPFWTSFSLCFRSFFASNFRAYFGTILSHTMSGSTTRPESSPDTPLPLSGPVLAKDRKALGVSSASGPCRSIVGGRSTSVTF